MTDQALGELKMFIVCYQDDDRDAQDQFVTARTPEEAFAMWRHGSMNIDPTDYEDEDRIVQVFAVPAIADKPVLHGWYDSPHEDFDLSHVSLTTQAVKATWDVEHVTVVTPLTTVGNL